jgi:hypothetical protein
MSEVIIPEDESFERALRRFKKKCEKAGILAAQAKDQCGTPQVSEGDQIPLIVPIGMIAPRLLTLQVPLEQHMVSDAMVPPDASWLGSGRGHVSASQVAADGLAQDGAPPA